MSTRKKNDVGPAAIVLALGLAIAGMIWAVGYARAADEKWKVVLQVTDHNVPLQFTYGTPATGPVYFENEAVCKEAIKTDAKLVAAIAVLKEMAAQREATFDRITCVLDIRLPAKDAA